MSKSKSKKYVKVATSGVGKKTPCKKPAKKTNKKQTKKT